jgi:hypothetical protein
MSEKPILFSGPMVRAILAGRKTQTRRVIKPQPVAVSDHHWNFSTSAMEAHNCKADTLASLLAGILPYQVGDILWVREAFRGSRGYDSQPPSAWGNKPIWYVADGEPDALRWGFLSDRARPSIHMPRHMSRIALRVTARRAERLQDITEADALAEGVDRPAVTIEGWEARTIFRNLIDSLNGRRGFTWNTNPWMAAYSFERVA